MDLKSNTRITLCSCLETNLDKDKKKKNKIVVFKDQSQNAWAKNSLRSDFSLAVKSNNFLLHVMLQTEVFPQLKEEI